MTTEVLSGPNASKDGLERAVRYMETHQLASGEIPVDASRPGVFQRDPSVFPTALATHSLSFAPQARHVRERAIAFLRREMDDRGLWKHWTREHESYDLLPPDLDDTSCASAALAAAGESFPDNRRLLLSNRNRDGLFRTWKLGVRELIHPVALFLFFTRTSAKPFDTDAVVNANALFYLGNTFDHRPIVDHLLTVLEQDQESSCDKWYVNPFVIWYFFSRALHPIAPHTGDIICNKIERVTPKSSLDQALAVCSFHYWNRPVSAAPLLAEQLPSGAWRSAPLYTGGRARNRDGSYGSAHPDTPSWGSEALTTAFCIEAISRSL